MVSSWSGTQSYHDFRQRSRQEINIRFRVERPRADAHRAVGKSAQRPMDVRRAVQARPHGHLERLVADAAEVRSGHGVGVETEGADAFAHIAMAEDLEAADFVQL